MTSIKRDATKQKWEDTEFPLVCETCLGDNPYLRMTSEPHGKKCKICEIPFTVFAWQAGTKGRWKRVEICKSCAKAKNVCQVCIYDLEFGLPVAVRDKVLREEGGSGSGTTSNSNALSAIPQSDANRAWFNAQQERLIANGEQGQIASTRAQAKLQSMARMEPRYERNLPKLCSFYAKGECNRGSKCPFRHEMPKDRNDPLSKQNTKDRFYGSNDPVAAKMIWKKKQVEEQRKADRILKSNEEGNDNATGDGDERSISTCFIRFDTRNDDTNHIIISEQALRDQFYSHGEIKSVHMLVQNGVASGAFIEYTTGSAAELAILTMNRKEVHGRKILVSWARQPKRGNVAQRQQNQLSSNSNSNSNHHTVHGPILPKAPPGAATTTTNRNTTMNTTLPAGFAPSAQVAAAVKARAVANSGLAKTGLNATNTTTNNTNASKKTSNLPRPGGGGGVIRRIGMHGVRNAAPKLKPYYPSSDPNRLGTQGTT